jgi:endogenous inhibitor of DNA gyrase (YacG/DUF329 family)
MATLNVMIKCPETGEPVPTGIGMDFEVFKATTASDNTLVGCPACGGTHLWQQADAFPDA